jgi:Asp-tRNA(Asn)/Glu-tRNA(Gln) amidotransferase A subunit family amidase
MTVSTMVRPEELTALEARKALDAGELTAAALVEACLERIEAREPEVRAWVHLDPEGARRRARELDAGPQQGLLHGIPFGAKDIIDTYDQPTTYGSPIYADHRPPWDGSTIALARSAGAIMFGKTVTTEFANRHPGPTRNPHNGAHTPGGSSSGSAAAVGDFHVPLALGTQTGGSVLRPAAYCGAYGYKPSFQHFGNAGVRTNTEAFDTVGTMARSVADLALMRAAVAELPFREVHPDSVASPRIAICRTPNWDRALPETRAAIDAAQQALADAGAEIVDLDMPEEFSRLQAAHRLVCGFESIRNYADELRRAPDLVSDDFRRERVDVGTKATLAEYRAAMKLGIHCRRWMDETFVTEEIDAILTPTAEGEAPVGLAFTGSPVFNFLWTHLYTPAVTMPLFSGPTGLPVGIQLVGRRHEDQKLLDVAAWADRAIAG